MLKKIGIALIGATFLAGCTTDPYTGDQKYPTPLAVLQLVQLSALSAASWLAVPAVHSVMLF